nr:serine/threonine-protein kinase [Ramlibacter sp.]
MTLKRLGRYELLRVLGKGAMGVVYEGRDPNLDRRVAIKTVKVENLSEEAAAEYEQRFRTEARSAARLQHPNIVSVYDSDRDGNVAFLVMEYIQGDDLKHHLDRGVRYSLEQTLQIIRGLLSALDYAHRQGVVHRDVKPANLLMEAGGRIKLTDFGVARIQDSGEATRTRGSMVGTLKYMAPEQVQGQKVDPRADLFSVGVVLYQLLTDKRPFDGDNDFTIIHQIIGTDPPPPSVINPRLPATLDAVLARALAKSADERFASARDFALALQAAIRRSDDQTVVPPTNPGRLAAGMVQPPTRPGTVPGGATTPGTATAVTQELELVYWKDVKDSSDHEELQGFLQRFPAGIYADLARRRLRRLAGSTDPTVPHGATQPGPAGAAQAAQAIVTEPEPGMSTLFPDDEPTRPQGEASGWSYPSTAPASLPLGTAHADTEVLVPAPGDSTLTVTLGPTRAAVPDQSISAPLATAPKRRVGLLAGCAGGLAVAGAVWALLAGGGEEAGTLPAAASSVTVAAAASATPGTATNHASAVAAADAPAAGLAAGGPAADGAATPATADRLPSHQARRTSSALQARSATLSPTAAANTTTVALTESVRPAARADPEPAGPQPQTVARGNVAAVEQCRSRLFLAKELCLAEHCDKPGTRSHPLCIKRRDEVRMREDARMNNGPQQ